MKLGPGSFLLAGSCALLHISCILPIPHTTQRLPETTGVLTRRGSPLAGASVWQTRELGVEACGESRYAAKTNERGEFRLEGERQFQIFKAILPGGSDALVRWTVCFAMAGSFGSWHAANTGPPGTPRRVELVCEFDANPLCTVPNRHDWVY
jgi:hypothetical protein